MESNYGIEKRKTGSLSPNVSMTSSRSPKRIGDKMRMSVADGHLMTIPKNLVRTEKKCRIKKMFDIVNSPSRIP